MLSLLLSISVGVGAINAQDGPDRENPVGIFSISHPISKKLSVEYFHASELFRRDEDRGVNILYIKMRVK